MTDKANLDAAIEDLYDAEILVHDNKDGIMTPKEVQSAILEAQIRDHLSDEVAECWG